MQMSQGELHKQIISIDSLYKNYSDLRSENADIKRRYKNCLIALKASKAEYQTLPNSLDTNVSYNSIVKERDDLKAECLNIQNQLNRVVNDSELRYQSSFSEFDKLNSDYATLLKKCEILQKRNEDLQKLQANKKSVLEGKLEKLQESLEEKIRENRNLQLKAKEFTVIKSNYTELQIQNKEIILDRNQLRQKVKSLESQLQVLKHDLNNYATLRNDNESLSKKCLIFEDKCNVITRERDDLQQKMKDVNIQIEQYKIQVEKLKKEPSEDFNQKYSTLLSNLRDLLYKHDTSFDYKTSTFAEPSYKDCEKGVYAPFDCFKYKNSCKKEEVEDTVVNQVITNNKYKINDLISDSQIVEQSLQESDSGEDEDLLKTIFKTTKCFGLLSPISSPTHDQDQDRKTCDNKSTFSMNEIDKLVEKDMLEIDDSSQCSMESELENDLKNIDSNEDGDIGLNLCGTIKGDHKITNKQEVTLETSRTTRFLSLPINNNKTSDTKNEIKTVLHKDETILRPPILNSPSDDISKNLYIHNSNTYENCSTTDKLEDNSILLKNNIAFEKNSVNVDLCKNADLVLCELGNSGEKSLENSEAKLSKISGINEVHQLDTVITDTLKEVCPAIKSSDDINKNVEISPEKLSTEVIINSSSDLNLDIIISPLQQSCQSNEISITDLENACNETSNTMDSNDTITIYRSTDQIVTEFEIKEKSPKINNTCSDVVLNLLPSDFGKDAGLDVFLISEKPETELSELDCLDKEIPMDADVDIMNTKAFNNRLKSPSSNYNKTAPLCDNVNRFFGNNISNNLAEETTVNNQQTVNTSCKLKTVSALLENSQLNTSLHNLSNLNFTSKSSVLSIVVPKNTDCESTDSAFFSNCSSTTDEEWLNTPLNDPQKTQKTIFGDISDINTDSEIDIPTKSLKANKKSNTRKADRRNKEDKQLTLGFQGDKVVTILSLKHKLNMTSKIDALRKSLNLSKTPKKPKSIVVNSNSPRKRQIKDPQKVIIQELPCISCIGYNLGTKQTINYFPNNTKTDFDISTDATPSKKRRIAHTPNIPKTGEEAIRQIPEVHKENLSPKKLDDTKQSKRINIISVHKIVNSATEVLLEKMDTPQEYMSPASPEPTLEETKEISVPVVIPTKKVMAINRGQMLINEMLQFCHSNDKIFEIAKLFSDQSPDFIAQLILDSVAMDIHDVPTKGRYPNEPPLTTVQRGLHKFIVALEKIGVTGVCKSFFSQADLYLRTLEDPVTLNPVTRLYVAICKGQSNYWQMRIAMCAALADMGDLAVPYIFIVLQAWVEVLPRKGVLVHNHILTRAVVQLILMKNISKPGYNLLNLRSLVFNYYEFSSCLEDVKTLFKDLLKYYIDDRNECARVLAIAFIEHISIKLVTDEIFPYLQSQGSTLDNDDQICAVITLVMHLTKHLSSKLTSDIIGNNLQWLKQFGEDMKPYVIKAHANTILQWFMKCTSVPLNILERI